MRLRAIAAVVVLLVGLLLTAQECPKENIRPVALFTVDQVSGASPLTVNFDATASYDSDGTIVSYSWDFGDGTTGTGSTTSHTFTSSTDHTYTVILTVTDDGGKTGSMSGFVVVSGSSTLFFDDFDNGLDPAWAFTSGNWKVVGGKLVESDYVDPPLFGYVSGGETWIDYRVDVDIHRSSGIRSCSSKQGIVVRATDDLNKVILWGGGPGSDLCPFGIWFSVIKNGQQVNSGGWVTPEWPADSHLTLEVRGNIYKLYVNRILRTEFVDSTHPVGTVGVAVQYIAGFTFDNFRVTALK